MPTFTIKNQTPTPSVIEFETRIDEDGDFLVTANGVCLLFISQNSGRLIRFCVSKDDQERLAEIPFNDDDEIALED